MTGLELSALALKSYGDLSSALINGIVKRRFEHDPEKAKRLKSNLDPHMEATFKRCSEMKTFLNPLTPANFLSIHATQRFIVSHKEIDHYGMVDHIRSGPRNIILSGNGGSGKSMFTRYLWLSLFVNSEGKIPLFIELRNYNNISIDDFLTYIRYSIAQGSASLTEEDFQSHLKNGDFLVILDGFDEILLSKRELIQRQIISIAENFPKMRVVITSRPEGELGSWPSFDVASVAPLHREDVSELISKAEFDADSKAHFLKRLNDTDLFEKHRSFLTNPLLASMMLLTFSHKFDIPDRMHLFYEQAFDALFQRHDAFKPGGFKREFKTSLSEDAFKRVISYFCLITYNNENTNFTREKVLEALQSALKFAAVEAQAAHLLNDLISCVCFLILDGLKYAFSHRSFQEYFTARCLSFLKPEQFRLFVEKFSKRTNDQVIFLLADMSPDLLRRQYILPVAQEFEDRLQLKATDRSPLSFFESSSLMFSVELVRRVYKDRNKKTRLSKGTVHAFLQESNDFFDFSALMLRLFERSNSLGTIPGRRLSPNKIVREMFALLQVPKNCSLSIRCSQGLVAFTIQQRVEGADPRANIEIKTVSGPEYNILFQRSFLYDFLWRHMEATARHILRERELEASLSDAVDNLFSV